MNPVETGFYYLQSRYYDAGICRFLNADDTSVLGLSSNNHIGANLFAYCNNNPVNYSDPTGFWSLSSFASEINLSKIFASYMEMLFDDIAARLVKVGLYVTKVLFPKVASKLWYNLWLVAGIVLGAMAIVVAAVTIAYKVIINQIKKEISNKIKTKDGRVDLSKFTINMPGGGKKGPDGWMIVKDTAKHAGSVWKLLDRAGKRVATLWGDGRIRGK